MVASAWCARPAACSARPDWPRQLGAIDITGARSSREEDDMDGLLLAARVLPRSSSAWRDWRNWPTVRDRGRPCATSACLAGWPAPLSSLLPLVELGVALALLPAVSAWWSALGALGLLLVFVVGIGVSLLRGRRPACHCFGQLHSAPVGWPTLARNGALAGVAGVV